MRIKLVLPIYYTYQDKNKFKTILAGLNEVFTMHHIPRNAMKKYFALLVRSQIGRKKAISGKFTTHSKIYYKSSSCDAPNILAVLDKFAIDALQSYKIINEDNVQHYVSGSWECYQDKENPRIEIVLESL